MSGSHASSTAAGSGSFGKYLQKGLDALHDKVPAMNQVQHTLQLLVKATSGISTDSAALARETKVVAKNLSSWGSQAGETDAIAVSTDRLGWLLFKSAEIEEAFSKRVEQSRVGLKDIRNFQNTLIPKQQKATALKVKLDQYRTSHPKSDKAVADQIAAMTSELEEQQRELATFKSSLEALKQQKLRECYALYFSALHEKGDKLAIIGKYGDALMQLQPFGNEDNCERVYQEAERELRDWHCATLPSFDLTQPQQSGLSRANTRFKNTHATELSRIPSTFGSPSPALNPAGAPSTSMIPVNAISASPSLAPTPLPISPHLSSQSPTGIASPPLRDPFSPIDSAPLPSEPVPEWVHDAASAGKMPSGPTLAETGSPMVGTGGPSSGQLGAPASPPSNRFAGAGLGRSDTIIGEEREEPLPVYEEGFDGASHQDRVRYEAEQILARDRDRKSTSHSIGQQ